MFELLLFEHDLPNVTRALRFGITAFVVDWEQDGKPQRQQGYDTEIRPANVADLRAVAAIPDARIWCRLNRFGPRTEREIETALATRITGLFLPMVTATAEVERFIDLLAGRCQAGILVETVQALSLATELGRLPLQRAYFGLNDFMISRGGNFLFEALLDGSVEIVRAAMPEVDFGFGGVTAVDSGTPLPCALLLQEMARLDCRFSFLRRSFKRDLQHRDPQAMIADIHDYWQRLRQRDDRQIAIDRQRLCIQLRRYC